MMNSGQPIDPGLIQALAGVGENPYQTQALQHQAQMAQALRQQANQQPQQQMAGKVAVRTNPLQTLGGVIGNVQGNQMDQKLIGQEQQQADDLNKVRGRYMNILAQSLRNNQGQFMSSSDAQQNPQNIHPSSFTGENSSPGDTGGWAGEPNSYQPSSFTGENSSPGDTGGWAGEPNSYQPPDQ